MRGKNDSNWKPESGCGKSTLTTNLGAALCKEGERVLLVDMDPSGNLTAGLGYPKNIPLTVESLMREIALETPEPSYEQTILHHDEGMDLLPANKFLTGMEAPTETPTPTLEPTATPMVTPSPVPTVTNTPTPTKVVATNTPMRRMHRLGIFPQRISPLRFPRTEALMKSP